MTVELYQKCSDMNTTYIYYQINIYQVMIIFEFGVFKLSIMLYRKLYLIKATKIITQDIKLVFLTLIGKDGRLRWAHVPPFGKLILRRKILI